MKTLLCLVKQLLITSWDAHIYKPTRTLYHNPNPKNNRDKALL